MTAADEGRAEATRINGIVPGEYRDGDVNHVLQPVIGILRLDLARGRQIATERIEWAVAHMWQACESETLWLARAAQDRARLAAGPMRAVAAELYRDHSMPPNKDRKGYPYRMGWWDGVYHAAKILERAARALDTAAAQDTDQRGGAG